MTPDVNVVLLDFPNYGREMVVLNEDGSYTILINTKLSHESQVQAYAHAMRHINNHDFEKSDVQQIEAVAHEVIIPPEVAPIPSAIFEKEIKRLKKAQRRIRRLQKEYEKKIQFIMENIPNPDDYFFRSAENYRLYGDDL